MFGIGFLEICVISVAALVLIGPQKLPQVMSELGKFFVQMRRVSNEVKYSVNEVVNEVDQEIKQVKEEALEPVQSVKSIIHDESKKLK